MLLEGVTRLEDRIGTRVSGVVLGVVVTIKSVGWSGNQAIEVTFEDIGGRLDRKLVFSRQRASAREHRRAAAWWRWRT